MQFDGAFAAVRAATGNPRLLGWSALVALVDAASVVALLVLVSGRGLPTVAALILCHRFVVALVLSLSLPGSYALYRGGSTAEGRTTGASLRRAGAAIRAESPRLLAASLVTTAVAVPATLALTALLGAVVLGVDTAAVWATAVVDLPLDRSILALGGVLVATFGGGWLVTGAAAYQYLLALDGERGPLTAWRASAVAATARPAWCVGQGLLRGLLLTVPWVAGFAALIGLGAVTTPPGTDTVGVPVLVASAVVFLAVAALARATLVAYHVDTYERIVRPAAGAGAWNGTDTTGTSNVTAGTHPLLDRPGRVAVAAVVLLAAVAGVTAVRTADLAPGPDVPDGEIRPNDADATVAAAVERTTERDFAFEFDQEGYDRTNDTWGTVFDGAGRIDRDGRELRFSLTLHHGDGETTRQRIYGADGVAAVASRAGRIDVRNPIEVRHRSGNWTAAIGRPFGATASGLEVLPAESEGGRRVANTDGTVTYAMTDLSGLGDVDFSVSAPDPSDEHVEVLNDTGARIVIDRETVTVRRFSVRTHFRDTYDEDDPRIVRERATLTVTDVGDVDVDRPDGLAGPGPLERLWDVVFYA